MTKFQKVLQKVLKYIRNYDNMITDFNKGGSTMNNLQVIKTFLRGGKGATAKRSIRTDYGEYEGRTLSTADSKLINYSTQIAEIVDNIVYLDTTKYSSTTSKIQYLLLNEAMKKGYVIQLCGDRCNEFAKRM